MAVNTSATTVAGVALGVATGVAKGDIIKGPIGVAVWAVIVAPGAAIISSRSSN